MDSEQKSAEALRHLALNEEVKAYVLEHPPLYRSLLHAAMRFVGGETLAECLKVAGALNQQGFAATVDFMGESTRGAAMAEEATREFLSVVHAIAQNGLNASVSLDLSHIGMVIDPKMGYNNAHILAEAARDVGIEVIISMEGPARTDLVLELHRRLCQRFDNVGVTLQAYLYRTSKDLEAVLERPGKIRLVKGAFEAPEELAMPRGARLNKAYRELLERLIASGHPCSIATHDPALLDFAHERIQAHQASTIEFEMLKGVALERLQAMQELGYPTRVYLPYGAEWYLYLCNRLAEYPPNIYQALADAATANLETRKATGAP